MPHRVTLRRLIAPFHEPYVSNPNRHMHLTQLDSTDRNIVRPLVARAPISRGRFVSG